MLKSVNKKIGRNQYMLQLVLISGLAGAGKSTALKILEDSDYVCVDNLPPPLLKQLVELYASSLDIKKVAIGVDTKSHSMLSKLPDILEDLVVPGLELKLIFLDAKTDILITRFSETRRKHPLSDGKKTISDCILEEREELEAIAKLAHYIDTSDLSANDLRRIIKEFVNADYMQMNIVLQSFGFKYGLPIDSDFVFDVRCLPNPHYNVEIRQFNGLDEPVINFLDKQKKVQVMIDDIYKMLDNWLDEFSHDNRNYLTVSIGCTGGKHRSVYIVEALARLIENTGYKIIIRHRQLS